MGNDSFDVDPDLRRASTLPSSVYTDPRHYEDQRERLFARSWQLAHVAGRISSPGQVLPWTLLEGSLDEPVVLTCDEQGRLHCLSNVCTHRGNLVVECEESSRGLRCRYHGRRFALDGRFLSMPEFELAQEFPSKADDLPELPLARWGPFVFVGLAPAFTLDEWLGPVRSRLQGLPLERAVLAPDSSQDYIIQAHWALYCDNYLEGFHIPFVHHGLAAELDYGSYRTELHPYSSVQIGVAHGDEAILALPSGHPDAGQRIAAYYWWLFPNLMLNVYPWGLSVNIVEPLGVDRTRVRFLSYVWDESKCGQGAGADLHRVELEDEAVVQAVQRGVRSRLYRRGRFSPTREQGVHHFHRLLSRFMARPT